MKKQIRVSCGILSKGNKYLLVQRPATTSNALRWEFPGGKIEVNETEEACLVREMKEELDIWVEIDKKMPVVRKEEIDFCIELVPFLCHIIKGEITLLEHLDMQWVELPAPSQLDICKGDKQILKQLFFLRKNH